MAPGPVVMAAAVAVGARILTEFTTVVLVVEVALSLSGVELSCSSQAAGVVAGRPVRVVLPAAPLVLMVNLSTATAAGEQPSRRLVQAAALGLSAMSVAAAVVGRSETIGHRAVVVVVVAIMAAAAVMVVVEITLVPAAAAAADTSPDSMPFRSPGL